MSEPNRCPICGDTTPEGKLLCWCCEHTSKLHPMEKPEPRCDEKREEDIKEKDGDSNGGLVGC